MKKILGSVLLAYVGLALLFVGANAMGLPATGVSSWPLTSFHRNPEQAVGGLVPEGLWQPDRELLKRNVNLLPAVGVSRMAGNSVRLALGQTSEWVFEGGRDPMALFWTGELWVSRGTNPRIEHELQRVAEIIGAYKQQLASEGWTLVVVPVPTKLGVHREWADWPLGGVDLLSRDPLLEDRSDEVYQAFHLALDRQGVTSVDLQRVFRELVAREPTAAVFPPNETHWSGAGIRSAADATARAIASVSPLQSRSPRRPTFQTVPLVGDLVKAYDPLPSANSRLRSIWTFEDRLLSGDMGHAYSLPANASGLVVVLGTSYTGQYTWLPQPVGFAGQLGLHLENVEVQNRPIAGQGSFKSFEFFWDHRKEIEGEFASRQGVGRPRVVIWEMPVRDLPGIGESTLSWSQRLGWH